MGLPLLAVHGPEGKEVTPGEVYRGLRLLTYQVENQMRPFQSYYKEDWARKRLLKTLKEAIVEAQNLCSAELILKIEEEDIEPLLDNLQPFR